MDNITTIQVDKETSAKLGAIAKAERRSKAAQIAVIVEQVYRATFEVVAVDELPKPEGAEGVPLVYIQKRDPA